MSSRDVGAGNALQNELKTSSTGAVLVQCLLGGAMCRECCRDRHALDAARWGGVGGASSLLLQLSFGIGAM